METKILLFDFDGTIAHITDAALRIYNEIARDYGYKIITQEDFDLLRAMSAFDAIRAVGIPLYKVPFIARRVRKTLAAEVPNLRIIEGIAEPLRLLKSKGYFLCIVSSNSKENIERFLAKNHIAEFDAVYGVSNLFGKHVKIKSLIRAHGWDVSSVMYIGDEVRDIEAARKAKVTSVAVTWGHNTEYVLAANGPDIILRDSAELASL